MKEREDKHVFDGVLAVFSFFLGCYLVILMAGAVTGLLAGAQAGCRKGGVAHKFESRIDYIFPAHDLAKRGATKAFWGSDLCNVPGWFMDSVYMDEVNKKWEEEGGWKQFEGNKDAKE